MLFNWMYLLTLHPPNQTNKQTNKQTTNQTNKQRERKKRNKRESKAKVGILFNWIVFIDGRP